MLVVPTCLLEVVCGLDQRDRTVELFSGLGAVSLWSPLLEVVGHLVLQCFWQNRMVCVWKSPAAPEKNQGAKQTTEISKNICFGGRLLAEVMDPRFDPKWQNTFFGKN